MKNLYLDWGVYQVRVQYDPTNINAFNVFYAGQGDLEGRNYRRLTLPETRAVMEGIYKAEKIKITTSQETPVATKNELTFLRDRIAIEALKTTLEKKGFMPSPKGRAFVAKFCYSMADAMLEARDETNKCSECGKEKL
jgi:hypothetical protein